MKRKYLMIVEKMSAKDWFEQVFRLVKEEVNFDLDIAVANNHILDTSNEVYQLDEKEISKMRPLKLNRYVDPKYKVVATDFYTQNTQKIKNLLENNNYDIVLNGCDPDEEGKLIFEYTVLTTGLDNYKQQDFEYKDITDLADLKEVFLSLNESKNEINKNEINVEMV